MTCWCAHQMCRYVEFWSKVFVIYTMIVPFMVMKWVHMKSSGIICCSQMMTITVSKVIAMGIISAQALNLEELARQPAWPQLAKLCHWAKEEWQVWSQRGFWCWEGERQQDRIMVVNCGRKAVRGNPCNQITSLAMWSHALSSCNFCCNPWSKTVPQVD